jgi:hypothetical protein
VVHVSDANAAAVHALPAAPGAQACTICAPRACVTPPAALPLTAARRLRARVALRSSLLPLPQKPRRFLALRSPRSTVVASAAAPVPSTSTAPDWAAVRADIADVIADPSVRPTHVGDKGPTLVRCGLACDALLWRGSTWRRHCDRCWYVRAQVRLAFHSSATYDKESNTGGRHAR